MLEVHDAEGCLAATDAVLRQLPTRHPHVRTNTMYRPSGAPNRLVEELARSMNIALKVSWPHA